MNLNNLQLNQQTKILIVIFFVLIAYVDTSFILKAQRVGLNRLDPKIAKLTKDLANLNQGLENMRLAQSKPNGLVQKKVARSSKLYSEDQISGLLQNISNAAKKLDIKILQINPVRQTQKDKSVVGQDKLISLLINLEMVCDYHNLGRFIQSQEDAEVFIQVEELKILTQLPDYMKQKVTLVLKTYVTK